MDAKLSFPSPPSNPKKFGDHAMAGLLAPDQQLLRALPCLGTVAKVRKASLLQWRYRAGLKPASLFSLLTQGTITNYLIVPQL